MYEILALALGFQMGFFLREVWERVRRLETTFEKKESNPSVVTPNPQLPRKESSFVVEPKSPQRVAYEEEQELRKANPGKF